MKSATEEMERVVKRDLSASEASCLLVTFAAQAILIANGQFKDHQISSLFLKIQRMVKSETKSRLVSDYTFDGLVPMSFGQGKTVLQYAIRGSHLYCAKIGEPGTIQNSLQPT